MDPSSSRIRTYELPKPEAGLAEWTSKIKALQRQVDADEEAEQKRLEEEIAAFRAARLRRSQGMGYGSSILDSSKVKDLANLSSPGARPVSPERHESQMDRQKNQDDALSKLTGTPSSRLNTNMVADKLIRPASSSGITSQSRAEPMSLAQFIGGRATRPRLNRHAPQQDAHDPTQFEQRTRIEAPHPVFGRGGIALPGMARPTTSSGSSSVPHGLDASRDSVTSPPKERDRRLSTPSVQVAVHRVEPALEHSPSPQKQSSAVRERTISTPSGAISSTKTMEGTTKARHSFTPSPSHSISKSSTQDGAISAAPPRTTSPIRPVTPRQQQSPAINSPSSPPQKSVSTPSLARPILPAPKPPSHVPNIGASTTPSPAFLKPPAQKEPTPSISRLQGRGFVQSMVQASSKIETRTPSPPTADKTRATNGKRASVLDRWQPAISTSASVSPPPLSPKPIAMRKSKTVDTSSSSLDNMRIPDAETPTKSLRSVPSLPSMIRRDTGSPRSIDSMPPVNTPGLGSATTMVVYKEDSPLAGVDELGIRRSSEGSASPTPGKGRPSLPAPSGKPLAHPTRDRAKLPRKSKGTKDPVAAADSVHRSIPNNTTTPPPVLQKKLVEEPKAESQDAPAIANLPDLLAQGPSTRNLQRPPSAESRQYTTSEPKGMVGARALPGLAALGRSLPTPPVPVRPTQPVPQHTAAGQQEPPVTKTSPTSTAVSGEERSTTAPVKHTRIPSTGNRATVMDVAQAFNEQTLIPQPVSPVELKIVEPPPSIPLPPIPPRNLPPMQAEKRKSSYEKYSAIILPPLPEEATPTSTPVATLARHADNSTLPLDGADEAALEAMEPSNIVQVFSGRLDEPLPRVEIDTLINRKTTSSVVADANNQTISIDVMTISGNTASTINQDPYIFYDSEILAIVHRFKVKSTGLVSSAVWSWQGKRGHSSEKEERKLQELAKRYGTTLKTVHQYREPSELVHLLGGQLITRQGARAHWSPENTAMHLVRILDGVIYIDEHDLNVKTLCSGFSYCLSILDTIYVWHGRGSTSQERQAAVQYAQRLSSDSANTLELYEGENDDDEMFWLILGNNEYAKADYWQWRRDSKLTDPRIWLVDSTRNDEPAQPIASILDETSPQESVFLIDCIWEFFVLVGKRARGQRKDILLAISLANELSMRCAKSRPFVPPIHVLILPTRLPCDLLLNLRGVEESWLNEDDVPDHMNIRPYESALDDLSKDAFDSEVLKNYNMLPLGVDSADLP